VCIDIISPGWIGLGYTLPEKFSQYSSLNVTNGLGYTLPEKFSQYSSLNVTNQGGPHVYDPVRVHRLQFSTEFIGICFPFQCFECIGLKGSVPECNIFGEWEVCQSVYSGNGPAIVSGRRSDFMDPPLREGPRGLSQVEMRLCARVWPIHP
jgi:hypothetical protein